ncbi:hypothetical protein PF011_g18791 [Phytophthora fragariae]|uniref:Ankyrin repeat protein n=1 Tax=Phytophthora fragariae TaxID=53985 RepID=A0A6A3JAL3_9STRA|nr:hypothetical protein PF011_g18791 [Phytophthora fragariae]
MDIVRWIIDADRKDMGDESDGGGDDSDEWDDFYPRAFGQDFPITSLGGEASLAVGAAAMGGHLEVAKYLHERVATPKTERESEREEGRFRRTLKYISRQIDMFDADKVSVDTMLVAAQNGHLDVVKWLYAEFSVKLGMDMFWLYDDDADKYFSVLDVAAGNGRLEVVKYLHEICQEAAGNAEDQDGLDTGDESMRINVSLKSFGGGTYRGHGGYISLQVSALHSPRVVARFFWAAPASRSLQVWVDLAVGQDLEQQQANCRRQE